MVDSIPKCRLFAITPRAGSRNHRYLVPPGLSWPERELAELTAQADRNPAGADYVAVARTVDQPSTGRKAKEMLILTAAGLKEVDASAREALSQKLSEYGERLERLVTREIDWETAGDPLVVENAQLGQWQRELTVIVERLLRQRNASTAPTAGPVARSQVGRSRLSKSGLRLAVLTLAAVALASCVSLTQCWDRLKSRVAPNTGAYSTRNDLKPNRRDQLVDEYLFELVDWGDSPPANDDKKRKDALDVVYRWYYESNTPANEQTWASDVEKVLEKLRMTWRAGGEYVHESEGKFDSWGLVENPEKREEMGLHRIDPVRLRRAFRELRKLEESAHELRKGGVGKVTGVGKVCVELETVFKGYDPKEYEMPEGPQPKFFVSKDVNRARILKDLLASEEWRAFCHINEKYDDLPALFGMMKQHREKLSAQWKNRPGGDDEKVDEWYRQLEAFVRACAEAAPESGG